MIRRFFVMRAVVAVILVALPVVAAGLLAWKGAAADRAAAVAAQTQATTLRLSAMAERLESAARDMAAQATGRVAAARTVEELHAMTARAEIAFAAIYRGERRFFPPEDSAAATVTAAKASAALAPALTAARDRLPPGGGYAWRWGAAPGGPALLACRRDAGTEPADYCAALDAADLRAALTAVPPPPGGAGRYVLSAPDDPPPADGGGFSGAVNLAGPLAGWRLSAETETAPPGTASLYPLIGVPAALLWAAGAWRFHQSRQAQWAESRRRAALAAQLSHDLRTPLANLRLYADLIRRRAADPAAVGDYAAVLETEIARLDDIAEAAVAAAAGRAEAPPRPALLDPTAAALKSANRWSARLAAAGCAFTLTGDGAGATGGFDPATLARILDNLLHNAVKFAAGTPVTATARYRDGLLTLTVRDHGPGLVGASVDPALRGAGLGLGGAARLAALHGGDLKIEEARPGLRVAVRLRSLDLKG